MKANDSITMQTTLESVLKDDIMQGIRVAEGKSNAENMEKPVKVFKTIGGLTNVGRTYFWCGDEVKKKIEYVQAQMVQKYGAEIYGASAQLKNQTSNGTASGTAQGDTGSSLISCTAKPFVDLSQVKSEASSKKDWTKFNGAARELRGFLNEKAKEEKWQKDFGFKDYASYGKEIGGILDRFKQTSGSPNEASEVAWNEFKKKFASEPWKTVYTKEKDSAKKYIDTMNSEWKKLSGQVSDDAGDTDIKTHTGQENVKGGSTWQPTVAWRIDIQTNFNESWYKRKFKSGFLNKVLDTVKTSIRANSRTYGTKDGEEWKNHKFSADQMEPGDKRKLDSLQWKMTNKVAKDYISMLLGWSRSKQYYDDVEKRPVDEDLKLDEGFGKQMAKNALSNRGILGRLKQKLFAGGQSSNVITVAFQLADYRDGWEKVQKKEEVNTGKTNMEPAEKKPPQKPQQPVSESCDPFYEDFMEERMELVKEVCDGKRDAYSLIEHCLLEG